MAIHLDGCRELQGLHCYIVVPRPIFRNKFYKSYHISRMYSQGSNISYFLTARSSMNIFRLITLFGYSKVLHGFIFLDKTRCCMRRANVLLDKFNFTYKRQVSMKVDDCIVRVSNSARSVWMRLNKNLSQTLHARL